MRNKPNPQKLFVDPSSENPLYKGSMALKDVRAGVQAVTVGVTNGTITLHEFATDWYVQTEIVLNKYHEFLSALTSLVADTTQETVYLPSIGIHRQGEECNPYYFTVAVTEENIIELWSWLWMVMGWSEAAEKIQKMFPGYFTPEKMPDIAISTLSISAS